MKFAKRILCMALACIALLGIVVPTNAASYADPNIAGSYKVLLPWDDWSSWTLNQLQTRSINKKQFTGEPFIVETEVRTRTCYIRNDGTIDTYYNVAVGLFGKSGGYREITKQYSYRTRILYWVNTKHIPTGLALLNYSQEKQELYADLFALQTMGMIHKGYDWCHDQLKAEVNNIVIAALPKKVGNVVSKLYNVHDLANGCNALHALRNYL